MRIHCKTLLRGTQWRHDMVLHLDSGGLITAIQAGTERDATASLRGVVVPGMPNVHSHAFQRAIAGRTGPGGTERDSFWSWREAMYRCANQVSPQQLGAIAAGVYVEMLKAGYTSCAEFHYIHHQAGGAAYMNLAEMSERIINAASDSCIALTLLPVLYCAAGFGETGVSDQQRRFVNPADQYLRLLEACYRLVSGNPQLALGVAPHSLRAVPGSTLQEVLQAWPHKHCPVHIHIAEQPAEIASSLDFLGARPVEWLLEHFPVDGHWCLIHATHMSDAEAERAAASEAAAGLCPTTEADLGDGVFRTDSWLATGGHIAIGSDSNIRISVAGELRVLEYNERLASGKRNVLAEPAMPCGQFLYHRAAKGGGVAIGQPVGQLEVGFRADLLELDDGHDLLAGLPPAAQMDSWVFAGDSSMIKSVWVAGRCVVRQGIHCREGLVGPGYARALSELRSL